MKKKHKFSPGIIAKLEQLFDALDSRLHEETYIQLQDKIFVLEADKEELEGTIEMMNDNQEHERDTNF